MKIIISEFFTMNGNWNAVIILEGTSVTDGIYMPKKEDNGFWAFPERVYLSLEERVSLDDMLDACISNFKIAA